MIHHHAADSDGRPAGRGDCSSIEASSMQPGPEVTRSWSPMPWTRSLEECSPFADVGENPAKDLAMGPADAQALVWGGLELAARASRRLADASAQPAGVPRLQLMQRRCCRSWSQRQRDPFADPFEDQPSVDRRLTLVLLDDGNTESLIQSGSSALGHGGRTQRRTRLHHRTLDRLRCRALRDARPRWHVRRLPRCRPGPQHRTVTSQDEAVLVGFHPER